MNDSTKTFTMKNTFSLVSQPVSAVVTLATILCLLFLAMPAPLHAQTNPAAGTTHAVPTNATADSESSFMGMLPATLALLIPIVAIVMGCSIPIAVVGLALFYGHRKNRMLHETVRAMIEKGVPIPPEIFKAENASPFPRRARRPRSDLRTGLIFIGVGIGVALFMHNQAGYVVLLVGLAFLAAWFLDKNNKDDGQAPTP